MEEDLINEVKQKIASESGCSIEELEKYDKEMVTSGLNKDGEQLILLRQLISKEIVNGTYNNSAKYMIYTKDGKYAGYVDVTVSNSKSADKAEIQYLSNKEFRNKGNITISLEEVLKDIFIDKSFDGLQIKPIYPKTTMKKVFLDISDENYASQAVAQKSGFRKNGECYELTEEEFLKREDLTFSTQEIGKTTVNVPIEKKDEAKSRVQKELDIDKSTKTL